MVNFKQKFAEYVEFFNNGLDEFTKSFSDKYPLALSESMAYAVKDGGKRVRPVLCFATAEMLGINKSDVFDFALSIELIHSYSLVHDDLPAMDNDDFRRGKPSTHKKFGEAFGILAGDGLLNLAFEVCLNKRDFSSRDAEATKIIADYAGANGMIKGQVLDLGNEKNSICEELLFEIIDNKTAKLITCPMLVASIISGKRFYDELKNFGLHLGRLFQIVDDIMDEEGDLESIGKTPHKDKEDDKLTSIKVFGLDGAKLKAKEEYLECKKILSSIPESEFLSDFADLMYIRKS